MEQLMCDCAVQNQIISQHVNKCIDIPTAMIDWYSKTPICIIWCLKKKIIIENTTFFYDFSFQYD